jgi:hypothetical protein
LKLLQFHVTHALFPALPSPEESLNPLLLSFFSLPFSLLRNQSIPCYSHSIPCPSLRCGITQFPVTRILFPVLHSAAESHNSLLLSFYSLSSTMLRNPQFYVTHIFFPAHPSAAWSLNSLILAFYFLPLPMLWNHSVPCYSHSVPCHPLCCG